MEGYNKMQKEKDILTKKLKAWKPYIKSLSKSGTQSKRTKGD
ncbi:hypothetical protein HanPSC8_Chr13g0556191 [Helianthus annuus]|nr:hypothetical protein HanPSC8_Chr13g0556191 [Helianthus annuus]